MSRTVEGMPGKAAMNNRICFLHVGTGKTGSSAIQYALTKAGANLLEQGYAYPDLSSTFEAVLTGKPAGGNAGLITDHLKRGDCSQAIELLKTVADMPHHLILSHEGLANLPAAILNTFGRSLRSLGYDLRWLAFFRPQVDWIASSYLQRVKTEKIDGVVDLDDYAREFLEQGLLERKANWFQCARKLEHALGTDGGMVEWYPAIVRQGPEAVVRTAFSWLGLPSFDIGDLEFRVINPTPGRETLTLLRIANQRGTGGKRFADRLLLKAEEAGVLGSKVRLGPAVAERVHAATRADNSRLLRRYCPTLSDGNELRLPSASSEPQRMAPEKIRTLAKIAKKGRIGLSCTRMVLILEERSKPQTYLLIPEFGIQLIGFGYKWRKKGLGLLRRIGIRFPHPLSS